MSHTQKITGSLLILAQLASPWVTTPAIISAVVFLSLVAIERLEHWKQYKAKLMVAEEALKRVSSSSERLSRLEEQASDHASKLNAINLALNIR